jgi:hypothetical protein
MVSKVAALMTEAGMHADPLAQAKAELAETLSRCRMSLASGMTGICSRRSQKSSLETV